MLVVVRGATRGVDPTYRCASQDATPARYAILSMDDNFNVKSRILLPASDAKKVEDICRMGDTVYVDRRKNSNLLSEVRFAGARDAGPILAKMRRFKSEEDQHALMELGSKTIGLAQNEGVGAFRGAAAIKSCKSFAEEKTFRNAFTLRHYGMQNEKGLCSDVYLPIPQTDEWRRRIDHAYRCMREAERMATYGASVSRIEQTFRGNMARAGLVALEPLIGHIGYESIEPLPDDEICQGDVLNFTNCFRGVGDDTRCIIRYAVLPRDAEPFYGRTLRGVPESLAKRWGMLEMVKDIPRGYIGAYYNTWKSKR